MLQPDYLSKCGEVMKQAAVNCELLNCSRQLWNKQLRTFRLHDEPFEVQHTISVKGTFDLPNIKSRGLF